METFWSRIEEYYTLNVLAPSNRTQESLAHLWGVYHVDQVNIAPSSGVPTIEYVPITQELSKQRNRRGWEQAIHFTPLCYKVLQVNVKWARRKCVTTEEVKIEHLSRLDGKIDIKG